MQKALTGIVVGLALMVVSVAPASAQGRFELGAGPTFQDWNGWSNGFAIDFGYTFWENETVGIAGIFDFSRNVFGPPFSGAANEEVDTSYAFGARAKFLRDKRVGVFVQGVVGRMKWDQMFPFPANGTDSLFGGGGGAQIRLTDMFDVKAQGDFFIVDGDAVLRVLVAGVVKFGG